MPRRTTTVSGIIIPTEWGENGAVLGAAIFDRQERQFLIQQDEIGKQLLRLVREDVEVQATITKATKGQTTLRVKDYWLKTGDDTRVTN